MRHSFSDEFASLDTPLSRTPPRLKLFSCLFFVILVALTPIRIEYAFICYAIFIATLIFIVASVTDAIDGYIARSRNLITDFGKFIDPLVDKILVISVFIYLVSSRTIPDWMVIIIIFREFVISGFRIIAASKGVVVAASTLAKFKTNSHIIAVIFSLLELPYYLIAMFIAVILTIISGAQYIYNGRDLFEKG